VLTSIVTVSSETRLSLASLTVAVISDVELPFAISSSGAAFTVTVSAGPGVRVISTVPSTSGSTFVALAVIVTGPAIVPAV